MQIFELAALAVVAVGLSIVAIVLGRRNGQIGWWTWGWAALLAAGLLFKFGEESAALRGAGAFVSVLFPGLQLAGALEYARRRVPRWLIPATGGAAAMRVAAIAAGLEAPSHLIVLPFELAALLGAALVIYRSAAASGRSPVEWMLIIGFSMVAVIESADAILDNVMAFPGVPFAVWVAFGIPFGGSQFLATLERMQGHLARSLHERERALQALEESNERFRAIAEQAHDLIVEADSEEGIRYVNPRFHETLGYRGDEVIGARIGDFAWEKGEFPTRADMAYKREKVFPPVRVRHRDGSLCWIEGSARVYRRGSDLRVVVIGRDVTEKLRIDEQRSRAQKLESLGLLAGGIAHDFNNLLTGILGNADVARVRLSEESPARVLVERVIESAEQAAELTRQLQAYSGCSPFEMRAIDVSEELGSRAELLRTAVGEHVLLELALESGLPAVEADPAQLMQLVLNLAINGAEACGNESGSVRISTGLDVLEAPLPLPATGRLEPGTYVYVEVADTGPGIDTTIRDRLFDPFFTTKQTGRGLGLAVVHGVVKTFRGAITIDSNREEGALFRLLLPTFDGEVTKEAPPRSGVLAGTGGILVVDDNLSVLQLVRAVLEDFGYQVFTAENGVRASEIMVDHVQEISLILLDAVIPGEPTEVILDQLRALSPDIPVLLMSGHAEVEAMHRFASGGALAGFVAKPFRAEELAARVRDALDQTESEQS